MRQARKKIAMAQRARWKKLGRGRGGSRNPAQNFVAIFVSTRKPDRVRQISEMP
jgi:hypothetical protein